MAREIVCGHFRPASGQVMEFGFVLRRARIELLIVKSDATFHVSARPLQFLRKERRILKRKPSSRLRGHNDPALKQFGIHVVAGPVRIVAEHVAFKLRLQQRIKPLNIMAVSGDLDHVSDKSVL